MKNKKVVTALRALAICMILCAMGYVLKAVAASYQNMPVDVYFQEDAYLSDYTGTTVRARLTSVTDITETVEAASNYFHATVTSSGLVEVAVGFDSNEWVYVAAPAASNSAGGVFQLSFETDGTNHFLYYYDPNAKGTGTSAWVRIRGYIDW